MARRIRIFAAPTALGRSAIRASSLALALTAMPGPAIAGDKLILQLHREAQFEFAGYYAALWKGFYREAGLEVEIKPGAPPGATLFDPVREVTERRAQFGTGTAQLLLRAAQGLPLLLLAPIFQQSGAAVYYRADGDFSSPRALLNARIGRLPASNILDLELRTALRSEGIDADKLKSVSIEPGQAIAALADHRVDAVVGSAWELPWRARERAVAIKSFTFARYRTEFYGDGLFTLQRFANADPPTAQRFREASVRGWEYALQHPDEIGARMLAELPVAVPVSDAAGFARYQSEVARKLARFPDVPLGQSNPERWSAIQQSLIAMGVTSRPVDLDAFLYNPGAERGGLAHGWTLQLLATTLAVTLLFTMGLLWRRRNRPGAVAAQASNFPELHNWITALLDRISPHTLVRAGLARLRATTFVRLGRVRKIARQLAASVAGLRWRRPRRPSSVPELYKRIMVLVHQIRPYTLVIPHLAKLPAAAAELFDRAWKITRRLIASTSGARPDARPIDLNATLTALERSIRRRLSHTVECRLSLQPEPWLCRADPNAATAMVLDLVTEAVADMRDGGELVIGTRHCSMSDAEVAEFPGSAPGDYVRITIKDNGSGLSPEGLDRVFYPETTDRPAAAASWEMTRRFGGFATVESTEGVGTAVHLYLARAVRIGESSGEPVADEIQAQAAE